jgi:magnesium transporter
MNVLLKNLTIINVIFLPLGVLAGMGGMSEYSMILEHYGISWQAGYAAFAVAMVVVGYVLLQGVKHWIGQRYGG